MSMGGGSSKKSKKGKKKGSRSASMSFNVKDWKPKAYVPRPEDEVRAVYSWGDGEHGQLGHRESYTREAIAHSVKTMPSVKVLCIDICSVRLMWICITCLHHLRVDICVHISLICVYIYH